MDGELATAEILESDTHGMQYGLHLLDLYVSLLLAVSSVETLIEYLVRKVTSMTKSIIISASFF